MPEFGEIVHEYMNYEDAENYIDDRPIKITGGGSGIGVKIFSTFICVIVFILVLSLVKIYIIGGAKEVILYSRDDCPYCQKLFGSWRLFEIMALFSGIKTKKTDEASPTGMVPTIVLDGDIYDGPRNAIDIYMWAIKK